MRMRAVCGVVLVALVGCTAPSAVRRLEASHPGTTYDGAADGCDRLHPHDARRFGDARSAVLWARQTVGSARVLPCVVTLAATGGGVRTPVYVLTRTATGDRTEQIIER